MTIQEMHIEIEQGTQSVAGNLRRKLYPEEIDWIINKMMTRYISTKATSLRDKPGSADSLVHLNRLATLLDNVDLPAFKVGEEALVDSVIPHRVMEILSVKPYVYNLCGQSPMQLRETAYLNFLQFPETTATEDFYKIVQIIINSQTVFNMQAYAALRGVTWEGLTGKDERWRLVSLIMVELSRAGYRVYWEKYGTIYKPWTFIIDADGQQLPSSINIDNTATAGTNSDVFFRTKFTNTPVKQFPGRFYFQTILPQMQEGAFSDTYYRSPLCYQEDDRVVVQYDDSFIVSGLRLYHIRRPRPVDLSLSENCELPETAQVDICDLAIEYIKGLRADPDWENKLRDNMTRTII